MRLFGVNLTERPLLIAEIGINHNGDSDLARKMIKAAAEAGADVVKFQAFAPEGLYVESWAKDKKVMFGDEELTLWDFIERVKLGWDEMKELKKYAEELGIGFLVTPFSFEDADFLDELGVEAFKIASTDLTNYEFLRHVARKGKPMIVSTGTSTMEEIAKAVRVIREEGNDNIILLHCISVYPAPPEAIYLDSIRILKEVFNLPVGYSDHTVGVHIPIAAIAFGSQVIEKHFTLDPNLPGPDQKGSMTPDELRILREAADEVWKAAKMGWKIIGEGEKRLLKVARRSVVASKDIKAGERIGLDNVTFKRPALGIGAKYFEMIYGRKVRRDIKKDEFIRWEDLE